MPAEITKIRVELKGTLPMHRVDHPDGEQKLYTLKSMRITSCSQLCLNLLTLGLLAGLGGSSSWGQEAPVLAAENPDGIPWAKGSVRMGAAFGNLDSNIGFLVGRESQLLVNGEDTLGLPSTLTVFRADALYRIGKARRHQVDFSYAGYHRNGQTTLTDPIDIGGRIVIPATRIDSVLNFDMIRLSYTYAFVQSDHVRIGGGLSAYVLPIEYGLSFAVGDTPPSLAPRSLIVPVPALALRADFRIWRDLYATSDFNGVYLELFGFEGSLFDASVAIEYRPWHHLALGVGYSVTMVDVGTTNRDPDYPGVGSLGEVDVSCHGILAFVRLMF